MSKAEQLVTGGNECVFVRSVQVNREVNLKVKRAGGLTGLLDGGRRRPLTASGTHSIGYWVENRLCVYVCTASRLDEAAKGIRSGGDHPSP